MTAEKRRPKQGFQHRIQAAQHEDTPDNLITMQTPGDNAKPLQYFGKLKGKSWTRSAFVRQIKIHDQTTH